LPQGSPKKIELNLLLADLALELAYPPTRFPKLLRRLGRLNSKGLQRTAG